MSGKSKHAHWHWHFGHFQWTAESRWNVWASLSLSNLSPPRLLFSAFRTHTDIHQRVRGVLYISRIVITVPSSPPPPPHPPSQAVTTTLLFLALRLSYINSLSSMLIRLRSSSYRPAEVPCLGTQSTHYYRGELCGVFVCECVLHPHHPYHLHHIISTTSSLSSSPQWARLPTLSWR